MRELFLVTYHSRDGIECQTGIYAKKESELRAIFAHQAMTDKFTAPLGATLIRCEVR